MRLIVLTKLLFLTGWYLNAQDTISVMHYNLLNYGNNTLYCTQNNNNIDNKGAAMGSVISYVKPDILTVNEMGTAPSAINHFLNNALNINGINYYFSSTPTNLSGGSLANFLFYDARKFVLHSEHAIPTTVRDVNIYKLYHNDPHLSVHHDTAFLVVICTHLKAGNTSSDKSERAITTGMLMDSAGLWNNYPAIFSGDFNLYTSSEEAWKNLTQPSDTTFERFHDPVQHEGNWQDNPLFASIHTQSTRGTSNGCFSGGGLDDRFDFILINEVLKYKSQHYSYVPGSYSAVGNDANHLNMSVNDSINTAAPPYIIQALYDGSDHLPVLLKLHLTPSGTGICEPQKNNCLIGIRYYPGVIELRFEEAVSVKTFEVYDLSGRIIFNSGNFKTPDIIHRIEVSQSMSPGIFLFKATEGTGRIFSGKVVVQ